VVNFSSDEHKRLIRDDHSVTIRSYAQGYPLGLGMELRGEAEVMFRGAGNMREIGQMFFINLTEVPTHPLVA
jgi:hypothetical protein